MIGSAGSDDKVARLTRRYGFDAAFSYGRAAICGAISSYNADHAEAGPRNLAMLISKGLTLKGFTIPSYQQHAPEFFREIGPLVASGEFVFDETVVDGVENAFDAWLRLMRGENTGKMLVRIGSGG